MFYEKDHVLSYVSFNKLHPHDDDSVLRVAFMDTQMDEENVYYYLKKSIDYLTTIYNEIQSMI